jgi:hypothetical protein
LEKRAVTGPFQLMIDAQGINIEYEVRILKGAGQDDVEMTMWRSGRARRHD